jgi:hypothetical protein
MNEDITRGLLLLHGIDPTATLNYSTYTGQFYVSSRAEVTDGSIASGVTEHRDTPQEAVQAFLRRLQEVKAPRRILTSGMLSPRREWLWNGATWVEYRE